MSISLIILCVLTVILGIRMLFSSNAINCALSLLGILVMTACIYGLMGEHMLATLQLVVYAGAIMVLFIFSVMLLNLSKSENDYRKNPILFIGGCFMGVIFLSILSFGAYRYYNGNFPVREMGLFSLENIKNLGGNARVMSHALFSQYFISFEVISLALLVAVVGAVVLAKRKFD